MFPPAASRSPVYQSTPGVGCGYGREGSTPLQSVPACPPSTTVGEFLCARVYSSALANPTARDGSGREGECVCVQVQVLFLRRSAGWSCSAGRSRSGWLERITTVWGVPRCIFPPPPADKFFCARAHGNFRELDGREATSGAHPWQARWGALDRLVWL